MRVQCQKGDVVGTSKFIFLRLLVTSFFMATVVASTCTLPQCNTKRFADCDFRGCEDLTSLILHNKQLNELLPKELGGLTKLRTLCVVCASSACNRLFALIDRLSVRQLVVVMRTMDPCLGRSQTTACKSNWTSWAHSPT